MNSNNAIFVAVVIAATHATTTWAALNLTLRPDSAPNGDVAGWKNETFPQVAAGTFKNMEHGTYPGTLNFAPKDAIVYSVPDYGDRLMWTYWIPGTTVAELTTMGFQVKTVMDWDGTAYTYDWATGNTVPDAADKGWIQPGSWAAFNDGVIGAFGNSWWAVHGTDPSSADYYSGVTQADIDALAIDMLAHQVYWTGKVRYEENGNFVQTDLQLTLVPEPATMIAGALLLLPFAARTFRTLRRKQTS